MRKRSPAGLFVVFVAALVLTACSASPLTALPLPFRTGTGEAGYQITVHMSDLGNLVPNAEVKVGDITVGTVTAVAFDNWTAKLTVNLLKTVSLPANAEARVAQKSLLGAEYLELSPPRQGQPVGTLRPGDDIPVTRTGQYPETEELLTALSALLNQGGLAQVQTITTELNNALTGHEDEFRGLIHNLGQLASTLDARKGDIVRALNNIDRLTGTLARQTQVIDNALRTIPPGLAVLERQRTTLVQTLNSVSAFGDVASHVINAGRDDLRADLQAAQPVLTQLANSGKDLTGSLGFLPTFPFASNTAFPAVINGDYGNLYVTVDLDANVLADNLLRGFTLAGVPLLGGSSLAGGLVNANPLTAGVAQLLPLPLGQREPVPTPIPSTPTAPQPVNGQSGGLLGLIIPGGN
ncbi:MCE family protein [Amycolatopsis sp. K13G38]|uniref:MCE family protein n=1 Tax=Amycolatopsis acididurans TaxID=2724524 RepID=A0ABX1IZV0_9PSEU|nr:MCE family protein [Amycolatopsis acididurans]NKQ51562.1 MCE family protein [Amycolatopsis acididurans]